MERIKPKEVIVHFFPPRPSGCVYSIPNNTFTIGETVTFTVTVTSSLYGLSSSVSIVYSIQGTVPAIVSVNVLGVSPSGVVATQAYTQLAGSYQLAAGYSATAVSYAWNCSVVSGAPACPDLTDTVAVVASKLNSNNLVLFPGVLVSGAQYTFRLTVTTVSPPGSGFGEVDVTINQLPTGGSFAVAPLQGVQFQDVFSLLVGGWTDPEGGNLQYNYLVQSSIGQSSLLSQPGGQDSIFTSSLPLGLVQLWGLVIDDTYVHH